MDMKETTTDSRASRRFVYLTAVTILGVAFLLLVWRLSLDSGAVGFEPDAGQAVSDQPVAVPLLRDPDFYGINTGPENIIQANVSVLPESEAVADDFVFEARVKVTSTGNAGANAGLSFLGLADDTHYNYAIFPNQSRIKLFDPVSRSYLVNEYVPEIRRGEWYTLKASVAAGVIRLYLNGAEITPPEGIVTTRRGGAASLRVRSSRALFDDARLWRAQTGQLIYEDDFSQGAGSWQPETAESWAGETELEGGVYSGDILLDEQLLASSELSPEFVRRMDLVAATGARSVRVFFPWNDIQPEGPDSYFWDYLDAMAIAAHDRDMTILPVLVYAPNWAVAPEHRGDEAAFAYPPADQADFARFTEATVRRYMPEGDLAREQGWIDGYGADHYEIGHEYNVSRVFKLSGELFFSGWLGNIDDFVTLLKTGHDAVKAACPDCKVLNGAAADGMASSYTGRTDPTGLRQFLWQGVEDLYDTIQRRHPGDPRAADKYFDILNIHTYQWFVFSAAGQFPDLYRPYAYPDPRWYQDRIGNTIAVMEKYGDGGKDIWFTETTYPSTYDGDPLAGFLGDQGQADAVKMIYAESAAFPQVKRVYWWYSTDIQFSVGLLRKDSSTKPSWDAYRELTGRKRQEVSAADQPGQSDTP